MLFFSTSSFTRALLALVALLALRVSFAGAPFDLAGPTLEIEVTRGARTLPAAEVPSLAVGDHIAIKADAAGSDSARYLMVAAFLRGATNPPPEQWFFPCETWTRRCAKDGLSLTVPEGAGQLVVFLAPQTGGAFRTLVNAVRGRPGAFVRTSQDLKQAALDHARLDAYLAAVRHIGEVDPSQLKEAAPLLARSLAIKVDEACLGKIPVLQAPCLAQGGESLILDDGHGASLAQALTSGPASDLAMEASNAPQLKSGYYGPFIGSIFDIAKILDSLHTAQYQYIPALTSARGRQVALTLNAPPSFHDPRSVLVVALPAVETPQPPALHPVPPNDTLCASKDPLVLPVDGAPVVFSTTYAHDAVLRIERKAGAPLELPARVDPARGGFVVSLPPETGKVPDDAGSATLHAEWGFDHYDGPTFKLADGRTQSWSLAAGDSPQELIVGRPGTIHLHADSVSCLDEVALVDAAAKPHKVDWKKTGPNDVEATLPLQDVQPGELTLRVRQSGRVDVQTLTLHAFSQAAHLESFTVHAGDAEGILRGNRLDEVKLLTVGGVEFTPGTLSSHGGTDELPMRAATAADALALKSGDAQVALVDGRTLTVKASVDSPRPSAALVSKTVERPEVQAENAIQLASQTELPLEAHLSFSLRAQSPAAFTREEKLEIATADGSFSVVFGVGAGEVMLQSKRIAVVTLDPARSLGPSAFGPLQFRRIVDGVPGAWGALATLVRLPKVNGVDCPSDPDAACSLSGSNLFLLESLSADADFARATRVPDGFTQPALQIPHPHDGKLYIKLRDDPAVVNVAMLNVKIEPPASADSSPASAAVGPFRMAPAEASGAAASPPSSQASPPAQAAAASQVSSAAPPASSPASAPSNAPSSSSNAPASSPAARPAVIATAGLAVPAQH